MKHLNRANWLEPDLYEGAEPLDAEAWRDAYLAIRLDPRVPLEIAAMFEAARTCMVYGSFYTPLRSACSGPHYGASRALRCIRIRPVAHGVLSPTGS